ncbi:MAG: penicillin-binding protein 2 [Phycisphaerales bacterium]|nr:MAG: penicillin-binding protein 2 [Phycisphaerales bacterium]
MSRPRTAIDRSQRLNGLIALGGIGLLFLCLGGRLVQIQIKQGPDLVAAVEQQRKGRSIVPARRGMIFDACGRVVAASRRQPDVFVDPALVKDVDEVAEGLGARLGIEPEAIARKIRQRASTRYAVVARNVGEVEARALEEMRHVAVGLTDRSIRTYPLGHSMAHVIGFVGHDGHGLEGIELAFEEHLAGEDGVRATIRDAGRRALKRLDRLGTPPIDGGHLVLTLDAEIQRIVEETLEETIQQFEASSAVGIVMSPRAGEVLAMACLPAFDPATASSVSSEIRRNRAVTDPVEPGSTFKPFILAAALDGGFVTLDEVIDCRHGTYSVGGRIIRDVSPHGELTAAQIVIKSSNVGMSIIGQRMGRDALHAALRRYNFGEPTGIECPGESGGVVFEPHRWTSYSVTSVPMGYEVGITPLQLITAFCGIISDGLLLRPTLIKRKLANDGSITESFDGPTVLRRILPVELSRRMSREVLRGVVEEGSGRRAQLEHYSVLGKTGTAKLTFEDRRGYEPDAYLASFIGAAPADDPQVAVLVIVRRPNPKLGYYGGTVSAPAVKSILGKTLAYLQVPPEEKVVSLAGM